MKKQEKNFDVAILVSSDGDYACLVRFLKEKSVFCSLVSPRERCSFLLRKLNVPIIYLGTQQRKLECRTKEKAPYRDKTP